MGNSIWRYKNEYLPACCVSNLVSKSEFTNMATGKTVEDLSHIIGVDKIPS
jgi:hypothetical protein